MPDIRTQAVTGLIPPEQGEALIREDWPAVSRFPLIATLGRQLTNTIVLAPLAWLLMGFFYFSKVLPILARRYCLTNRRLMIRCGWAGKVSQEVALADIDEVRVQVDNNTTFFRAATLEIVSKGQVALRLPGVPEADSFRVAILNACAAWVPGKSKHYPFSPATAAS